MSRLSELLNIGLDHPDRAGTVIRYRYIQPNDSIDVITDMLHEAYGVLASQGMRFFASHQDATATRRRMARGETIVALDFSQKIVGIVTLSEVDSTRGSPFYDRDGVASFGQFAVRPSHQGRGIGTKLLSLVEDRAREKGVQELALDTSERATQLIAMYQAKGFRFIEYVQWSSTNYRSLVFSKTLASDAAQPSMSSSLTIRRLEPEDAEIWAALRWEALERHPLAFGASLPADVGQLAESGRARLTSPEDSATFGAFDGPALLGIVGIVRESGEKERHKARIWGMYVTPDSRRRGMGRLLMDAAIGQARSWLGVDQVSLSVTEAADDARRLYERIGFRLWGREPRALYWEGRYADELYMILDLR